MSCSEPRYRSVVWIEEWPSRNFICSRSPPLLRQSLAQVRRRSWAPKCSIPICFDDCSTRGHYTKRQKSYAKASLENLLPSAVLVHSGSWSPRLFPLPTLLHDAALKPLNSTGILRIKLGDGLDHLYLVFHRMLHTKQHYMMCEGRDWYVHHVRS